MMIKRITKEKQLYFFKKFKECPEFWAEYIEGRAIGHNKRTKYRFRKKYQLWLEMGDNYFMTKYKPKINKRTKDEISNVVDNLTNDELKDIAKRYLEIIEEKKKEASNFGWNNSRKAFIFSMHRSTFYKKNIKRKYVYDYLRPLVAKIHSDNKEIYGSRKIAIRLYQKGYCISDRTLRNYMKKWGIASKTRRKKRKCEIKNTNTMFENLVNRNYNPIIDNIVATDISYIPANVIQHNVYLSIVISHKTKLIESWKLSNVNDTKLVIDTISSINTRGELIIHSDHGKQYSGKRYIMLSKKMNFQISMSRLGNSLDNREAEYFFGCLKGEFLKYKKTYKLELEEINKLIEEYVEWYNTKRIQSRLQWKTPMEVSHYAI